MTIHTVERGDSIYSIARMYGVPQSRIITDNMLENPSRLVVGEDIVILYPTETYTVRGGDTLSSISRAFGVSIDSLYRNNPVLNGQPSVYPGQILNISYDTPPLGEISTNGYAYPNIDRTVLRRTLPYLTYLSVFSYGINDDGTLIAPRGGEEEVIQIAWEYGTIPLLVLTSLSERGTFSSELATRILSDSEFASTVISNIVRTVKEKGYGGVDVDFEYIPAEYAKAYADFVSSVSDALGGAYPVFVSLAPKYRSDQPGLLYGGHNYALLGEAADKTLLMTYEWGYTYGPPMAVSPINEVRRVIDYAVSEIPRDKIFIGVPNYGYDWSLPFVRGETKAQSLGNVEAVNRALERNAAIQYDDVSEAPFYTYYDRPTIFEDAVEHIVWFENARSAEAMLSLINEYGLDGAGIWNIMKYFPALWLVLNSLYSIRKLR